MKKTVLVAFLLVITTTFVFAYQDIYNANSFEYRMLMALSKVAETQLPNPTSGLSGDQMLNLIKAIDQSKLTEEEKTILDTLYERIEKPSITIEYPTGIGINSRLEVKPQVFLSVNKDAESVRDWVLPSQERLSALSLGADFFFKQFAYGTIEIDNLKYFGAYNYYGFETNFTNAQWDMYKPYKAFVSLGSDIFNLELGKNRVYYTKGKTGSVGLGDNFIFSNFAKLSAVGYPLSYDLTLLAYDSNTSETNLSKYNYINPSQYLFIHRMCFTPFKFVNISLYEGMLVYGINPLQDPRVLNPFMIMHNYMTYDNGNANNYFGLEIDVIPCKGLEVHIEAMFDQIQLKGESQGDEDNSQLSPNAYSVLANIVYSKEYRSGILEMYVEGAYVSPAMYLREPKGHNKFDKEGKYDYHNIDLIVGNSMGTDSVNYSYLGYKYGCDTVAAGLGASWFNLSGLDLSFDTLFTAHGIQGIDY